jgi:hypothetical protein
MAGMGCTERWWWLVQVVWVMVWVMEWVSVWATELELELEGLDCHNRRCSHRQSLHHCRKLDHFHQTGNRRMKMHHPIGSSNMSRPKLGALRVQGEQHA